MQYGLNEEEEEKLNLIFPFSIKEMEQKFKYLGFHLNPNNYKKANWYCLLKKIKKIIRHWKHKFLSLGGRYILVKLVLESIHVYWLSLAWIPKSILTLVKSRIFIFCGQETKKKGTFY